MQLIIDDRDGVHNKEVKIDNVEKSVAIAWFVKLDGKQHTLLHLERDDGSQFMVGGGPLQYVITLDDGKRNLTLRNSKGQETKMVELCAGGQYGEYPEAFCVNQKQAAKAVSLFFEGNERHAEWA